MVVKRAKGPENPTEETSSTFDDGIPSELVPQNLSVYSSREKLEADLDYREQKFEALVNKEIEEFIKTKDRYGKDEAEYEKLISKHRKAREDFRDIRNSLRKKYSEGQKDQYSEDTGLR